MADKPKSGPTDGELEILNILWKSGPSTVRQVNDTLNLEREVGYTTTLKLMQIMTDKNLVEREESGRTHIYRPVLQQSEMQEMFLDKVLNSAFGGSAMKLVMQALGSQKATKEELQKIKELIEKMEGGKK